MNEKRATEILKAAITDDGSLHSVIGRYIDWENWDDSLRMDGVFDIDDLEAIVWWIRNKSVKGLLEAQRRETI